MNDYTKPVYAVDGREFKTVTGLFKYLTRKHGAGEMSGVGSDHVIRLYHGYGDDLLLARYSVSRAEIGKPMILKLL